MQSAGAKVQLLSEHVWGNKRDDNVYADNKVLYFAIELRI